jgi:UDP-sugar pyrophosphorylase
LFAGWEPHGVNDDLKHGMLAHAARLEAAGLVDYIKRARVLLQGSKSGENPFKGWTPSVPEGVAVDPCRMDEFSALEALGLPEIGKCGFVLVAGGLGERLGFNGIKISLPTETLTFTCYIEHYCRQIGALQDRYAGGQRLLPLAIMVSDDTHDKTVELLREKSFFGLSEAQVTLMKQEKVAALSDNDARIALAGPYQIDSKPHGHGDVHQLMHTTQTADKWARAGIEWVFFFQDTNGLSLVSSAVALGVSVRLDLEVNSMAVPRKAKQAVGAITRLLHEDGREMTVNVEYNQLDPLLRAT